jgi:type I restriction enzyme S subunit
MMRMAAYSGYESYKYSGEGWIEDVPEHWEIRKLKHLFQEKKHKQNLTLNCGSISFGEVIEKDDERVPLATKASYQELSKGEFLINPLNLNYDLKSLRIGLSNIDVVVSAGYLVLQAKGEMDKRYFKYLLHRYDVAYMKLLGSGVRQTINFNHIANSLLLSPPLEEQRAIAAFLDEKCVKIDEAVKIKEDQIALLRERRQIIIQDAVTRGVNPAVPMKDSEMEWIGQIPAHWAVKKAGWYFSASKGSNAAELTKEHCGRFPGQFAVYSGQTENEGVLGRIENFEFDFREQGCMLCSTVGAKAMTIRFLQERFSLSQNCMIITPLKPLVNMEFFSHAFFPIFAYFRNLIPDHMQASFRMEDFYQMRFLLPPLAEQIEILNRVRRIRSNFDGGINIKEKQITALKEYKTSLINAAVTGKIKVV